jgi:hypothetical protein
MSVITGVSGPPDPDSPLVTLFSTKSFPPGLNTMRYNKADDLLTKASTTLDPAARTAVYRNAREPGHDGLAPHSGIPGPPVPGDTRRGAGFRAESLTTLAIVSRVEALTHAGLHWPLPAAAERGGGRHRDGGFLSDESHPGRSRRIHARRLRDQGARSPRCG